MEQLITCKICFEDKVSKEDINLTGDVSDHQICIDCYKNIQKSHISKMEQLITCKICFEDKNTNITLEHINPTGDVSDHQMCGDCYKNMRVNCCPFCRCNIIISEQMKPKINYNILLFSKKCLKFQKNIYNKYIIYNK
jgi:hypothetical protein